MAETEMVEEVKGLIADGFALDKIKANLVKIGYNETDVNEIIKQAQEASVPKPVSLPDTPKPAPAVDTLNEDMAALEPSGEDDLLLAASSDEPELMPPAPAPAPPAKKMAVPPKHGHRRHHHQEEAKPPKSMDEEEKPKSGAGKAIMIFLFAFILIAVMAYFILFPKLGISLTL